MALKDNLVAHWAFEEVSSDTRVDSQGDNDLTLLGTVTQQTGKVGNCAYFIGANSNYLYLSSNNTDIAVSTDDSFAFTLWIKAASSDAWYQCAFSKGSETGTPFMLRHAGGPPLDFLGNFTGPVKEEAISSDAGATGDWLFVYCWYDLASSDMGIRFNADSNKEWSTDVSGAGALYGATYQFRVGNVLDNNAAWKGYIDELSFWKGRVLESNQVAALYNNGAGKPFATWDKGGNQAVWWWSKMQSFYDELKRGLIPPWELRKRYGELAQI